MIDLTDVMELPYSAALYIYGTGRGGRLIHDALWDRDDITVLGFIDSSKPGTLRGLPVYTPDVLKTSLDRLIIVASAYWEEIGAALAQRGFTNIWNAVSLVDRRVDSFPARLSVAHHFPAPEKLNAMLRGFIPKDAVCPQLRLAGSPENRRSRDAISSLLDHPENAREIVAIGYWGRSGSFLLSNLFDRHPQVLSVPPHGLQWVVQFFAIWFSEQEEFGHSVTIDTFVSRLMEVFQNLFKDSQDSFHAVQFQCGRDRELAPGIDSSDFEANFRYSLHELDRGGRLTLANIFRAIHVAYAASSGQILTTEAPVIVWQAHDLRTGRRELLRHILGPVRFVLCVRYPERAFNAHLQWYLTDRPTRLRNVMSAPRIVLGYMCDTDHQVDPDERLTVIRFEDMHNHTEAVMRALISWLDLDWDPVLLETTCDGHLAWVKSGAKYVTGTSPASRSSPRLANLSSADRLRARYLLRDVYRDWYGEEPFGSLPKIGGISACLEWAAATIPYLFHHRMARQGGWKTRLHALAVFVDESFQMAKMFRAEARRRRRGSCSQPLLPIAGVKRQLGD